MPKQPLPQNPSVENLRKQSKTLLKAARSREPQAVARFHEFHPRANDVLASPLLSDAQLVIARTYGFPSWPELKGYLEIRSQHFWLPPDESKAVDSEPIVDEFIRLACLDYQNDHASRQERARQLFASNPSIAKENIYAATVAGDIETVRRLVSANPAIARLRGGPLRWEPILYASYSRLNSTAPEHSTLEVARLLLNTGADPNAGFLWDGNYLFTALTGAFGEGERGPLHQPPHQYCYELARILLEAGADPNDSQTLYNRMFTGGTEHLELLFEFGLGKGGDGVWFKRLGNQAGSPADMLQQQMGWAAKYNQMARLRLLVQHGVDVNLADTRFQRPPYEIAVLNGNKEIAEYLLEHGARSAFLNDLDLFFAACLGANAAQARALLRKNPTLITLLGDQRAELLQLAAESDKRDAIRLMSELGFDLNERRRTTALHNAAMAGHLEMVKLLIELGADPNILDTEFKGKPLGWAVFGGKTEVAEYLKNLSSAN